MKVKLIRSLPPDVRYPDADTGRLDSDNRQASEPVRVLPAKIELSPVSEKDLEYIRKVLMYDRSSKLSIWRGCSVLKTMLLPTRSFSGVTSLS